MIYIVGNNMPGFLPDSDPWVTTDWERARDVLEEEISRFAEERFEAWENLRSDGELSEAAQAHAEGESAAAVAKELLAGFVQDGDFAGDAGGRVWWIESRPAETREEAVAEVAEVDLEDVSEGYSEGLFDVGSEEWLCLTDDEADEHVADYIRESVWAFRPEFLASYMPNGVDAEVLAILQERCEDANDALLGMLGDSFDSLVEEAMACDGRGHFLSSYDGEEREEGQFFLYRLN